MIDEKKTFELFGYTSDTLSYGSGKKVLRVCGECGEERILEYKSCVNLCFKCSRKTKEYKLKLSENHADVSGKNNPMYGRDYTGDKHPGWKGGRKMSITRASAKRRKLLGFIPHNKPQENYHGHHLDFNHVLYIPKELHTSIWHSVIKNINMDIINDAACDWYLEYQIQQ